MSNNQIPLPRRSSRNLSKRKEVELPAVARMHKKSLNERSTNKKAPGKRTAGEDQQEDRLRAKKLRRKCAALEEIGDLPVELVLEIFGFLDPIDLLNLSRTSKFYRSLLMTRSSISVWKLARRNVPMPECPPDLNEPQYANLAFGKECYFCQQNLPGNMTYWASRLRTCLNCLGNPAYFTEQYCDPTYPRDLEEGIPAIGHTVVVDGLRSHRRVIPLSTKRLWGEGYKKAKDKQAWVAENKRRYFNMSPLIEEYYVWSALWDFALKLSSS